MSSGSEAVMDGPAERVSVVDMSQLPGFWMDGPRRIRHVLEATAADRLAPVIGQTYPLSDAATAHADIEARRSIGKSLLLVRAGIQPAFDRAHHLRQEALPL
jgi:NADPH2:quinone reductase